MLRDGESRYTSGTLPTDYQYTGQRSQVDAVGLYYYNARWYDPVLGRFAQRDIKLLNQQFLPSQSLTESSPSPQSAASRAVR